jgi:hypothetical protein
MNLGMNIDVPSGSGGFEPIMDLGSNVNAVLPLVDITPYLAAQDLRVAVEHGWDYVTNSNKGSIYNQWQQKKQLYKRPKGDYWLRFAGKKFTFKI